LKKHTIACIGECMVEMRKTSDAHFGMAFGGDVANTAIYLCRLLEMSPYTVDFISALGDDPYSREISNLLISENVGTENVNILTNEMPGLYFINTDDNGERFFYYYRSSAAARKMFKGAEGKRLLNILPQYEWIYLSGISLSILDEGSFSKLFRVLSIAKAGGSKIVFDGNYRAAGWEDSSIAQEVFSKVLAISSVALVTFSDEQIVFGDNKPIDTVNRMRAIGIDEGAVKLGEDGCLVFDANGETFLPITVEVKKPVDTTAAGDSFNAGFLFSRLTESGITEAGDFGNRVAGMVIQYKGAIVPKDAFTNLR
jgi:2-dehydro-3-deoxygluconokinase